MSRPELTGDASIFYNTKEARKYDSSSRMIGVQREITERAIELLKLPTEKPSFILDIGCGSGLSGQVLEEHGHVWVGCDLSRDMLDVASERIERKREMAMKKKRGKKKGDRDDSVMDEDEGSEDDSENESDSDYSRSDDDDDDDDDDDIGPALASTGDLMHHDMGTGLPFRPATFDACISISAIQWLCYSATKNQIPKKRLIRFFSSLYQILRRGGRAVLQFYPETAEQAILISECAAKVGFAGGVVVDYPNSTKAKKHYLVLTFDKAYKAPQGLTDGALLANADGKVAGVVSSTTTTTTKSRKEKKTAVRVDREENKGKKVHKKKGGGKSKDWILQKKEVQRKKGKDVRPDTKYTGRKRPAKF